MHGDYFAGSIHRLSDGWHWSFHAHNAGPFEAPREAKERLLSASLSHVLVYDVLKVMQPDL